MKKTSSRLLTLVLALIMVASLAACGGGGTTNNTKDDYYNKTGLRICDETITISVSGMQGNTVDWESTYLVDYVEKELGIKMDCEPFPSGAGTTPYTTMLASGEIPDLLVGMSIDRSQIQIDGDSGYWLNFADYLDLMPNLKKMLEDYPDFAKYVTNTDGSIYGLTRVNPSLSTRGHIYYDKTVLAAAGYTGEIKTITDFENALRAIKNNTDKIPLSITFDKMPAYNADIILRTAFGIPFADNSYMIYADDNGDVQLGDISDNNKAYLEWLNKLYREGLLVISDRSSAEYRQDIADGKYGFFSNTGNPYVTVDDFRQFGVIAALTHAPYTTETNYLVNSGLTNTMKVFVNAETAYPEAICRLLDYFCGEEGKYMAIYGKEGEHFDIVTDQFGLKTLDAKPYALAAGYTDANGNADTTTFQRTEVAPDQIFAMHWGFFNSGLATMTKAELQAIADVPYKNNNPNQWKAIVELAFRDIDNISSRLDQALTYTEDEANIGTNLRSGLKTYLKAQKIAFIMGTSEVTWDQYVAQVKTMGWNTLQPIEQAAWDRAWG